ncbi:MAG: hypothetical protein IPG73_01820 [Ignavibacteria bacterium]|nr:hypothetical protein [Ignavibacteria bacterium]
MSSVVNAVLTVFRFTKTERKRHLVARRKRWRKEEGYRYVWKYMDHFGSYDPVYMYLLVGNSARASDFIGRYTDVYMKGLPESIDILDWIPSADPKIERLTIQISFTTDWCCTADIELYRDADPWFDPTEVKSWSWHKCQSDID